MRSPDPLGISLRNGGRPARRPKARTSDRAQQRRAPGPLPCPASHAATAARRATPAIPNGAVAELLAVQAECAAWLEALPESLHGSATAMALQEMVDLDIDTIAAVQPPIGYGRD